VPGCGAAGGVGGHLSALVRSAVTEHAVCTRAVPQHDTHAAV
jgi:glycerate kinase